MTTTEAPQKYEVIDGQRVLTFTGTKIASAETSARTRDRWTEITLYQTSSGKYVIETIGRSDVYHRTTCTQSLKGQEFRGKLDPTERHVPCLTCRPTLDLEHSFVERDIYNVTTFDTPEALIESMYRIDKRDSEKRYLSRASRQLLDDAMEKDPKIRAVLDIPIDIT